jgi:mono/diheme cytochrome c family protein
MRKLAVAVAVFLAVGAGLGVIAATAIYVVSQREMRRTYSVTVTPLAIPTDSAALARGAHLARSVGTCVECHGEDLGGKLYADMGPVGVIAGPNLTRGRGGIGDGLTVTDWVRALRYGVRRDSTSLIVMPSEVYAYMSDADLAAVIAYARQVPPVDREMAATRFGPLGRALLAAGKLGVLVAPKTPRLTYDSVVPPEVSVDYGRYLANIGGCHGCHGFGLSGGRVAGPEGLPPASNLTPGGTIGSWTEADFVRAMRQGTRPDGSVLNTFMPWPVLGRMTDDELQAIWLYLRSVPSKPFGNK